MSEPLLSVREIHTYYGDSYVLQGVSLDVPAGAIVAILGRNGMGKTTLIRSVAGLTPPRRGDVIFKGRSQRGRPAYAIAQDGMAIVPCSMKTLASIANGFDDSLISRAAGVCLKEQRRLVVVPRETPLSRIHLENMVRLAGAGATLLPAMPGFYHRPKSMEDLIGHVIGKVLDQFGIDHNLFKRWGG